MSYESGKVTASVTGSVTTSVPEVPSGASFVAKNAVAAGIATTTIHTTSAGKTFYILSIYGSNATSGAYTYTLSADLNGDGTYHSLGRASSNGSWTVSFSVPLQLPEGKIIQIVGENAGASYIGGVVGYEL